MPATSDHPTTTTPEKSAFIGFTIPKELEDKTFVGLRGLDELKFPDECFQFDLRKCTDQILRPKHRKGAIYRGGRWLDFPNDKTQWHERGGKICDIFNRIGESILKTGELGKILVRKWTSKRVPQDQFFDVDDIVQPDAVVMNTEFVEAATEDVDWPHIFGVTMFEIETGITTTETMKQLIVASQQIFQSQPDRRFVLGLCMVNNHMLFAVFNRGCILTTDTFDIHESPERLIRIIAGFMFANRTFLGFKPNMEITEVDGQCSCAVTVNARTYDIEEVIHIEHGLHCRGTVCLKATCEGKTYAVKSAWFPSYSKTKEPEVMQQLQGVEGVVQLAEHEYVKTNGISDDTLVDIQALSEWEQLTKEQLRMINKLWDYRREQVNIVSSPFGRPLRMFKSIRELFRVCIDTVDTIQRLHSREILHRDISPRNILIADKTDGSCEGRGLLIDFDSAIWLTSKPDKAPTEKIGTFPYMAMGVFNGSAAHRFDHDLESLFIVLCCLLCSSSGPIGSKRANLDAYRVLLGQWPSNKTPTTEDMAYRRDSMLISPHQFEDRIISELPPYFGISAVKECLRDLRDLLFSATIPEEYTQLIPAECGEEKVKRIKFNGTPRAQRDPDAFFDAFRNTLCKAYERIEDTPSSSQSATLESDGIQHSTSYGSLFTASEGSKEDSNLSKQPDAASASPVDSGVTIFYTPTSRKRKATSSASGAPPVKRLQMSLESESSQRSTRDSEGIPENAEVEVHETHSSGSVQGSKRGGTTSRERAQTQEPREGTSR